MIEILCKPYNFIFVICIATIIIAFIVVAFISWDWRKRKLDKLGLKDDETFQKAFRKANLWRTVSMFWMISEYLFTIIPFIATVIVIHLDTRSNKLNDSNGILTYSIISLGIIIFSFAINPKRHMRCYRKAYKKVDYVLDIFIDAFQFGTDEEKAEARSMLITAIADGEADINKSYDVE